MSNNTNRPLLDRVCLIGTGLIGGSMAFELKQRGLCNHVIGVSRSKKNLARALERGFIDSYQTNLEIAVKGANLVIIAVPLGSYQSVLAKMASSLAKNTIITDVGSAKFHVMETAKLLLGDHYINFVPGHPIAGTEHSGVEAAHLGLFAQKRVVLTPDTSTREHAIEIVRQLWLSLDTDVVFMDAEQHDQFLAATSHLPHMLAFTIVDVLAQVYPPEQVFQYASGGFRDFSRVASSDPVMWHDICMENRTSVAQALDYFSEALSKLSSAVKEENSEYILEMFKRAKDLRNTYVNK